MPLFTDPMVAQAPLAIMIAGVVIVGLWVSNIVFDRGVPNYISRKIGHGAGGLAFLAANTFTSAGWPIILAAGFGFLLLAARLVRPATFRGVGGTGRSESVLAEIWFAWVAVPVFMVAWYWWHQPEVGVASLLFMAWGDGATGLVRSQVYHRPVKGLWGSLAMLCVCLVIAWVFISPFWIGVVGSAAAVVTEWACGDVGIIKWADDNWAIPLVSMATILGMMALHGTL